MGAGEREDVAVDRHRPCLIYGRGLGADPDSIQLPLLAQYARKTGVARHVGNGAIARALRLGPAQPWPVDDAIRELGHGRATYSLASNSRVRAKRLRALGWAPRHASVLAWIETAFQPVPA